MTADRRPLVSNELAFRGTPHKPPMRKAHLYVEMTGPFGTVVACSVCGRIRRGETMPANWQPIT